jgi:hypothetical protein
MLGASKFPALVKVGNNKDPSASVRRAAIRRRNRDR